MRRTDRLDRLFDRGRQALYAAALLVAIGSLWSMASANATDDDPDFPPDGGLRNAAGSATSPVALGDASVTVPSHATAADGTGPRR